MQVRSIPLWLPMTFRIKSSCLAWHHGSATPSPADSHLFTGSIPCQLCSYVRAFAHAGPSIRTLSSQFSAWLTLFRSQLRIYLFGKHFLSTLPETLPPPQEPIYFIQSI